MTVGEIIFAVLVGVQDLFFLVGLSVMIVYLKKFEIEKSDKLYFIASILWGISPLFSMVGVFFGIFL